MPSTRQLKIGLSNADKTNMANQVASQTLDKVINGPITIDGEETSLKEKIEEVNEAVQSVNDKANDFGDHPNMTVAKAHDLVSEREIDDVEESCPPITIGTAGGNAEIQNGYQKVEEIRGKSVKWNQLYRTTDQATTTLNGITYSRDASTGVITVSGTSTSDSAFNIGLIPSTITTPTKQDHKYLIRWNLTGTIPTAEQCTTNIFATNSLVGTDRIYNGGSNNSTYAQLNIKARATVDFIIQPEIFDLTDIYGAGNEPTNIVDVNIDYPKSDYDFNVGSLESSKSISIESIGMNQFDGELEVGSLSDGSPVSITQAFRSKNFIEVVNGDIYKFSVNNAGQNSISSYQVYLYDCDKNYVDRIVKYTNNSNIDLSNYPQVRFVKFVCYTNNVDAVLSDVEINFRLYWDTENVPYKPYEKQTINLPNLELRSAGDVYDVIYPSGGGKRRIGTYTFTGEESGTIVNTDATTGYVKVRFGVLNGKGKTGGQLLCPIADKAPYSSYVNTNAGYCFMPGETGFDINIGKTNVADTLSALVGKTIFFELGTETDITEQENPGFLDLLKVDNYGVIKFNSEQAVQIPQAYFIRYTISPAEWVDSAYERTGGDASKIALVGDVEKTKVDFSSSLVVDNSANLTEYRKELYFVKSKNSIKLFCYYSAKNETESAINGVRIINTNLLISDEFITSKIKDAIGNPLSDATASAIGCLVQAINNDGTLSLKGIRLTHSSTNQITFYDGSAINIPANGVVEISIEKEWFVE